MRRGWTESGGGLEDLRKARACRGDRKCIVLGPEGESGAVQNLAESHGSGTHQCITHQHRTMNVIIIHCNVCKQKLQNVNQRPWCRLAARQKCGFSTASAGWEDGRPQPSGGLGPQEPHLGRDGGGEGATRTRPGRAGPGSLRTRALATPTSGGGALSNPGDPRPGRPPPKGKK